MSVQIVAARPSPMWRPISLGDSDVKARMHAGRLASREYASAVLFMLVRGSQLPAELVDRSLSWLRVVDQECCRGEGLIRKLGSDIGLKTDPVGRALCSLKQVIDQSGSGFETADADRQHPRRLPTVWAATLFCVKESLVGANLGASSIPKRLRQEIGDLICDFETDLAGLDWQACCETMAVLDRLVFNELMASPSAHPLGPRRFPELRQHRQTERALVSLRTLAAPTAVRVELMMSKPTTSAVDEAVKTTADDLEQVANRVSADLTAAMNESISTWIGALKSAWEDNHAGRYCENFTALRQALLAWVRNERRGRLGPVEPL